MENLAEFERESQERTKKLLKLRSSLLLKRFMKNQLLLKIQQLLKNQLTQLSRKSNRPSRLLQLKKRRLLMKKTPNQRRKRRMIRLDEEDIEAGERKSLMFKESQENQELRVKRVREEEVEEDVVDVVEAELATSLAEPEKTPKASS